VREYVTRRAGVRKARPQRPARAPRTLNPQRLSLYNLYNVGLRYEYEPPMTSSNNIYSRVDPGTGQVLFANINSSASLGLSAGRETSDRAPGWPTA
jgi:hypothetical protein